MSIKTIRINQFSKGLLAGIGIALLAGAMLGADQGQRPRQGDAGAEDGGPYYVTASGAGARLWQFDPTTRELTFINEFNPVRRGGR